MTTDALDILTTRLTGYLYQPRVLAVAASRGYDDEAHRAALVADTSERLDSDAVTLTHPANWLTEEEVETLPWPEPPTVAWPR